MNIKKLKKYSLIALLSLLGLWVLTIALVYFLVDIEKLKNIAIEKVNQNTNAELSIGELKLKVFPKIYFELQNINLKSSKAFDRKNLFSSKSAKLSFNPIMLLFGKSNLKLSIINPNIDVYSNGLVNNLQDIVTPSKEEETTESKNPIDFIFFTSALFEIKSAVINYTAPDSKISLNDFNLTFKISPASRTLILDVNTPVKYLKDTMSVDGPIFFNLISKISGPNSAKLNANLDASKLEIKNPAFKKEAGKKLSIKLLATSNLKDTIDIKTFDLFLIDKILSANGTITDFKNPKIDFKANINKYDIKNFASLSESVKAFKLSGLLDLDLQINGTLPSLENPKNNLKIDAKTDISKLSLDNEMDKLTDADIKTIFDLNFNSNPIFNFNLSFNDAKETNNLTINAGNTKNSKNLLIDIKSSNLNLNSYLKENKNTKLDTKTKAEKTNDSKVETPDFAVLTKEQVLTIKEMFADKSVKLNAKLDAIAYTNIEIKNFIVDGLFNSSELGFNKLNLEILKGTFTSAFKTKLTNIPSFEGKLSLSGLDVKNITSVFMPKITDAVEGKIASKLSFKTSGYMMSSIKKNLLADGDFSFKNFTYKGEDLNALIKENLGDKVSDFSEKQLLGTKPGWETIEGVYNIKDEKINIIKLLAKESLYEATAKGWLSFNERMDMYIDFKLPYKNIPYEALKIKNTEQVLLPVHLEGPVNKPKFDTKYLLEFLANKIKDYEIQKLKSSVKKEATTKVKNEAKKAGKKAGKDILKKFGF